jgi:hypothetical protein
MKRALPIWLLVGVVTLAGCGPEGQRAGFLLGGTEAPLPADWTFTDGIKEIAIQVHTPYLIPHAVTIWCAQVDNQLYVGASAPQTKHWPGWVDRDPNVRLRIGEQIYAARLVPVDDPDVIARLRAAYAAKYQLPASAASAMGEVRYWHVSAPNAGA